MMYYNVILPIFRPKFLFLHYHFNKQIRSIPLQYCFSVLCLYMYLQYLFTLIEKNQWKLKFQWIFAYGVEWKSYIIEMSTIYDFHSIPSAVMRSRSRSEPRFFCWSRSRSRFKIWAVGGAGADVLGSALAPFFCKWKIK